MAYEETLVTESYEAASDLSSSQYQLVKVSADDTVDLAGGSTDDVIGVNQGTSASGESAEVAVSGITKVAASDSLSAGDLVTADSDAKAQKVTTVADVSAGTLADMTKIFGKVVNGAGSGEYASVLVDKQIAG